MDANFDILESPHFGIRDEKLRRQALTHSSYSYENPGEDDNERLEFYGDAYLKAAITNLLSEICEDWNENQLTVLRSKVERTESLASFAKLIRVHEHLRIGNSCQGVVTEKMLEDAFEAIVGAIHREGGQTRVEKILIPFLRPTCESLARAPPQRSLSSISSPLYPLPLTNSPIFTNGGPSIYNGHIVSPLPAEPVNDQNDLLERLEVLEKVRKCQNPVSALKEWRDRLGKSDIDYKFEKAGGYEHLPHWKVTCIIAGTTVGTATKPGKKQDAKSAAAEDAINKILYTPQTVFLPDFI